MPYTEESTPPPLAVVPLFLLQNHRTDQGAVASGGSPLGAM
jgi:hypothetical protein